MKTIITLAIVIGITAALELAFGIDETGAKFALVILVWCFAFMPLVICVDLISQIVDYEYRGTDGRFIYKRKS